MISIEKFNKKEIKQCKKDFEEIITNPYNRNRRYCIFLYVRKSFDFKELYMIYTCYDFFMSNIDADLKELDDKYYIECELKFLFDIK